MDFQFIDETQGSLKMCIYGPSGSGKSYTALCIAKGLGGSILVADSENQSVKNYKGTKTPESFDFRAIKIPDGNPKTMIQIIKFAEKNSYDNLIIDSLSYSWTGPNGELDLASQASARMRNSNSWASWKDVTPLHNQLLEAILACPLNIITTLRSKTEWVKEEVERGGRVTVVPKRVGLSPIYKENSDAEYDIAAEMDSEHRLIITKSRFFPFADRVIMKPGPELGEELRAWMVNGSIVDETNIEPVFEKVDESPLPSQQPVSAVSSEEDVTKTVTASELLDDPNMGINVPIMADSPQLELPPRFEDLFTKFRGWLAKKATTGNSADDVWELATGMLCHELNIDSIVQVTDEQFDQARAYLRGEMRTLLIERGLVKK